VRAADARTHHADSQHRRSFLRAGSAQRTVTILPRPRRFEQRNLDVSTFLPNFPTFLVAGAFDCRYPSGIMNFNRLLKEAIQKGACRTLRGPVAGLRHDVAALKRQVRELRRGLRDAQKALERQAKLTAPAEAAAAEAKPPRIRPTGPMVLKLRRKLGLTQAEMARLAGVSSLTVWKWEHVSGRIKLRGRTLAAFAQVRGLGKRAARRLLAGDAKKK
jgi:DNA-binding transcriptional regulator YiaG